MTVDGPLRRLPLGAIRPLGWMRAQLRQDLDTGFAGRLDALSPHVARDLFRERLSRADGFAAWWDAESRGNWLWGYTLMAALAEAPAHVARADALVAALRDTQDADGYLGIHAPGCRFPDGDTENGELWGQSRALMVLLAHAELAGDAREADGAASLAAARRAAGLTLRAYGCDPNDGAAAGTAAGTATTSAARPSARSPFGSVPTASDRTGVTHGLCFVDALQLLHEQTGDAAWRAGAERLLAAFDRWPIPFPNDDLSAASLALPARPFGGHAVHTAEHLRVIAYAAAGDRERLDAALRKLRSACTPAGALVGDEQVHGLPGSGAPYETCTTTELLFSLQRVMQVRPDPSLGDWIERLAFNAGQAARQPDGRAVAYLASDTRTEASATRPDSYSWLSGRHGRFKLSPTHDDVACCCNPNATRLLPHYVAQMWLALPDGGGFAAIAYGPAVLRTRVDGIALTLTTDTAYPFEDRIRFTVEVAAPLRLTLLLRRPGWVRDLTLAGVDADAGAPAGAGHGAGWLRIARTWTARTSFTLDLGPAVLAVPYAVDGHAVLRGPLQFVAPLPHRAVPLQSALAPPWHDEALLPADDALLGAPPSTDGQAPDLGLRLERDEAALAGDRPWHAPGLRLVGDGICLVPMGQAALRRACFVDRARFRAG